MSHPYRQLIGTPALRLGYLSVLLSAIPLGTITLGLVISVESWTGSLRLAGTTTALFTLGNALGLTLQGVLIDRLGDRLVVVVAGLVSGPSLGVVALLGGRLGPGVLAVLVLVSGLSVPAITTAVRRSLPLLTEDPAVRSAGYAALSVMFQLAFTVGPLLVSLALVATSRASDALLLAAAMIVTAAVVFGLATPVPQRGSGPGSGTGWSTSGTVRPLLRLYGVGALTGAAAGMTTLGVPGAARAAGVVAVAGLAFAAGAVGEVSGALVFGSRSWPSTERRQLSAALLAACAAAVGVYLASGTAWLLVLAVGVGGALGAPVSIRMSSLLDDLARPAILGRAYAAMVSIGLVAAAAGTSLAGRLSVWLPPHQLLLGPPVLLSAAAVLSSAIRQETPTAGGS